MYLPARHAKAQQHTIWALSEAVPAPQAGLALMHGLREVWRCRGALEHRHLAPGHLLLQTLHRELADSSVLACWQAETII